MSVETALLNLQAKWLSIDGVNSAPDYPPEAAGAFPFAVSYERSGRLVARSYQFGDELVTLYSELHVARAMLPRATELVMPFRDQFLDLLIADPTLGGTISAVNGEITWMFGRLGWGQEARSQYDQPNTLGYRFEIPVKVQRSVSP